MSFVVVIPARYASTRLPGKALLDIAGKPMVVHVADRAKASGAAEVWVATDDERVVKAVAEHGHQVLMTSASHVSGTDRIAEVAAARGWADHTIVVNVQGDEPRIAPGLIREVAETLEQHAEASMSTACHAVHRQVDLFDPNVVKVVLDARGDALYFSRATIPWARDALPRIDPYRRTSGLPAYRHLRLPLRVLRQYTRPEPPHTSDSRPLSNCGRCGTGFVSPSPSPGRRRRPAWTRPRTLRPCAACSLPTPNL
jgi:3-deoxy-manno-octulosonate cytidylyltransferase (CMP-KDO synthetase)